MDDIMRRKAVLEAVIKALTGKFQWWDWVDCCVICGTFPHDGHWKLHVSSPGAMMEALHLLYKRYPPRKEQP